MTDNIYSDQMPNTYGDGWYDCIAFVEDLIAGLEASGKYDKATLDELINQLSNA
jgi:hypothetical protein